MSAEAIKALIYAVIAAAIFSAGWLVEGWRMSAEIDRIHKGYAEARAQAATDNAVALDNAQYRGDQLALQLAGWENTLTVFAEEKNREIAKLATGRRCLDAGVVSVLNRPHATGPGGPAPQAAGVSLRAPAAVAAGADDGSYSTDADVSGWIGVCQRSYETCRGRLDAIADFYREDSRE